MKLETFGTFLREKWRRPYKAHGYTLVCRVIADGSGGELDQVSAYTVLGAYIGDALDAYVLCVKLEIRPLLRTPGSQVCSIGRSKKDGKWYGWSHRALKGFRSRAAAERFAESVS